MALQSGPDSSSQVKDFRDHLPLRGLHWNSPNRPLRLIDNLYITLESATSVEDPKNGEADSSGQDGRPQSQSVRSRDSDSHHPRKERRHQIPGLRQTPYLKILLLRCDDTDTYKTTSRKEVREWIKSHAPSNSQKSSKTSSQENHDAYEWMVMHVVMPDSEQRIVWPDRNSNKILGYLRDDFNGSSKTSLDRVSQIPATRLSAKDEPKTGVPETFKQQANEAWDETLGKFKQLILASFDQRVRQYEEDIREKGAQRTLPGWNFNTFFVLKEGLARGFESVGLVEDALSGYDELQAELEAAIHSTRSLTGNIQNTVLFQESSPEITKACQNNGAELSTSPFSLFDDQILDVDKKQYRDRILSNDISVFDFKTYVFARQLTILRRLGTVTRPGQVQKTTLDAKQLCEVCHRTAAFIASAGDALRRETLVAVSTKADNTGMTANAAQDRLASQMVSAWVYNVCLTVLKLTNIEQYSRSENSSIPSLPRQPQSPDVTDKPLPQWQTVGSSPTHLKALLASRRANLLRTARRALESLAAAQGWHTGWTAVAGVLQVVTDQEQTEKAPRKPVSLETSSEKDFKWNIQLREALYSEPKFHQAVAVLISEALECHSEAGDARSTNALRMDLILHNFMQGQYSEAARKLEQLIGEYDRSGWYEPYTCALAMLCHCSREIGDDSVYIKSCLSLASKLGQVQDGEQDLDLIQFPNPLSLIEAAATKSALLKTPLVFKLHDFIDEVSIEPYMIHRTEGDGFSLRVRLGRTVLRGFTVDKISVVLVCTEPNGPESCELEARAVPIPDDEPASLMVSTCEMKPGCFRIQRITLSLGKLNLIHEINPGGADELQEKSAGDLVKGLKEVRVWQSPRSLDVEIEIYEEVDLDQLKSVAITVYAGDQDCSGISLRVRSGTSGLRLHTAQASLLSAEKKSIDTSQQGCIKVENLERGSSIRLKMPFQVEHDVKHIMLKADFEYTVSGALSKLEKSYKLPVLLPLGVNVQDIFKTRALFSKFAISSSTNTPLRVIEHELKDIDGYRTACPNKVDVPYTVFSRQPMSLIYRISRQDGQQNQTKKAILRLRIDYECLDEEILKTANEKLRKALFKDGFDAYTKLLQGHMKMNLLQQFNKQEIETFALLAELRLVPYENLKWPSVLNCLPVEEQTPLEEWLRSWHAENQFIRLFENEGFCKRSVSIPVEIPPMQVVQTASLHLLEKKPRLPWKIGDAIPAKLEFTHVCSWDQSTSSDNSIVEISYEMDASADTWVIGGERRGVFQSKEGERRSFIVLLLPQRAGNLAIPALDVRVRKSIDTEQIQCELDYRSQGQSVLVLPGIGMPTAGVSVRPERKSTLLQAA